MQIGIDDLSEIQLNYAVGKCMVNRGIFTDDPNVGDMPNESGSPPWFDVVRKNRAYVWGAGKIQPKTFNQETGLPWVFHGAGGEYKPTSKWGHGGPIIEIMMDEGNLKKFGSKTDNLMYVDWAGYLFSGSTFLLTAMKCFVCSELGDNIEIPETLIGR